MARRLWTREEHILAFNLYCRIPFGKTHKGNPEVIKLANIINRTPSSVGLKLGNFARLDPALKKRGIGGMPHGAKGEEIVWNEFNENAEDLAYESEKLLADMQHTSVEISTGISTDHLPKEGKERNVIIKQRINQNFFRKRILSAYDNRCCITGLAIPQLLVAGHIIPWSQDEKNRLNPQNGLCLNMLHDKAFDRGLMWINEDFRIHYTDEFKEQAKQQSEAYKWLKTFEGTHLTLPKDFAPSLEFLASHKAGLWR